jgi:hypothetical protein
MAEEPFGVSVGGENLQLIPTGSPEQVNLAARLESGLLRAKTWRYTPFPPLAILVIGTTDGATPPVAGGTRRRLRNTEAAKIGSRNVLTEN